MCGTPDEEFMKKITSEEARTYIKTLPVMKKRNFKEYFKGATPDAIDLLEQMLQLDCDRRPSAEQALGHKYLEKFSDPDDEPNAEPFDDTFEESDLNVAEWKSEYLDVYSFSSHPFYFDLHRTRLGRGCEVSISRRHRPGISTFDFSS